MIDLATLEAKGVLRPLDRHLGAWLARSGAVPLVALAGAFASRALADGDTCLDLEARVRATPIDATGAPIPDVVWPSVEAWREALAASPLAQPDDPSAPLVVHGTRVWLARYRAHERALAASLLRVAATPVPPVDAARLDATIRRLFPGRWANDEQEAAVRAFAGSGLCVLAGGPGTGKTTTVVRMLAAVLDQAAVQGRPLPRALLLAPTGKAAARLREGVAGQIASLDLDADHAEAVREALPREARTIHRSLGVRPGPGGGPRRDASRPLSADLIVVDEASMVDLGLAARLFDAVKPGARVILVGDPQQLAAVGAGAVLAEICATGLGGPVGRSVARLVTSRRFDATRGIGALARALEAGDAAAVRAAFDGTDVVHHAPAGPVAASPALLDRAVRAYRAVAEVAAPADRLAALERFRVLGVPRQGPAGVATLNTAIERALERAGVIDARDPWYTGRPILVTANDPAVGLANGDVGVVAPAADGTVRVWFDTPEGPRPVLPSRLPPHETVYATTVHKSQGSEYDEVLLVLPTRDTPLLTRELLYTAVTRARQRVEVLGDPARLDDGVRRQTVRAGGLASALASAG